MTTLAENAAAEDALRAAARACASAGLYLEHVQSIVWGEYRSVRGPAKDETWWDATTDLPR